jgi:hypothetical protein
LSEIVGNPLRVRFGVVCLRQATRSTQSLFQQEIAHVAGVRLDGMRKPGYREREIAIPLRQQAAAYESSDVIRILL